MDMVLEAEVPPEIALMRFFKEKIRLVAVVSLKLNIC